MEKSPIQKLILSAAENGNPKDLKNWIKEQINSNTVDKFGRTALFIASKNGHLATVKYLLEIGATPANPNHPSGKTPLHGAAKFVDDRHSSGPKNFKKSRPIKKTREIE